MSFSVIVCRILVVCEVNISCTTKRHSVTFEPCSRVCFYFSLLWQCFDRRVPGCAAMDFPRRGAAPGEPGPRRSSAQRVWRGCDGETCCLAPARRYLYYKCCFLFSCFATSGRQRSREAKFTVGFTSVSDCGAALLVEFLLCFHFVFTFYIFFASIISPLKFLLYCVALSGFIVWSHMNRKGSSFLNCGSFACLNAGHCCHLAARAKTVWCKIWSLRFGS